MADADAAQNGCTESRDVHDTPDTDAFHVPRDGTCREEKRIEYKPWIQSESDHGNAMRLRRAGYHGWPCLADSQGHPDAEKHVSAPALARFVKDGADPPMKSVTRGVLAFTSSLLK